MGLLGLDLKGFLAALVIGALIYAYGGLNELALIFLFLLLSLYITPIGMKQKKKLKVYDHRRGVANVLSNGIVPMFLVILGQKEAYIGSVAAITADKFASEIGVLDKNSIEVLSWKKGNPGKSGVVSFLGTFSSFLGALTIGFVSIHLLGVSPMTALKVGVAGLLGSLADSFAGYFEERGIGNKETSNLICALVGGLVMLLWG